MGLSKLSEIFYYHIGRFWNLKIWNFFALSDILNRFKIRKNEQLISASLWLKIEWLRSIEIKSKKLDFKSETKLDCLWIICWVT